jgi:hypothetical protein
MSRPRVRVHVWGKGRDMSGRERLKSSRRVHVRAASERACVGVSVRACVRARVSVLMY